MRIFLVALVVASSIGCAAAPSSDAEVARRVESQVWSPYCPGVLLSDCATRQARELRSEIEERAAAGDSETEILSWVRDEYGSQAIARPDTSGAGLVVWLIPAAIFLAGGGVLARYLIRASRTQDHGDRAEQDVDVQQ